MAADQRKVWTAIAASFDRTRTRPWPHVLRFLQGLPKGSRVLDLMAGNGRHARSIVDAGHRAVAVDWSQPLCAILRGKVAGADVVLGDATALPLADASMDACVYVAGLHGIPSPQGRDASLRELRRVLKPGGQAQLTVWSRDAPKFAGLPPGIVDVDVPWKGDGHQQVRTYHLYGTASLRAACESAGWRVESIEPVDVAAPRDNLVALIRA